MKTNIVALAVIAGVFAGGAARADIVGYRLYHYHFYFQDAGGVDPTGNAFRTLVRVSAPTTLSSGSVTIPGGTAVPLTGSAPFYSSYEYGPAATIDAKYPFGTYTFTVTPTGGGTVTQSVDYTSDAYPTAVSEIVDYAALEKFDPTKQFDLLLAGGFTLPNGADRTVTNIQIENNKGICSTRL